MKLSSTDIHCHILPGVDDGFSSPEESLKAISRMSEAGCEEFIFTPHLNPDVYPESSESRLIEAYNGFLPSLQGKNTHLAAEYMVVKDFEHRVEDDPKSLLTYPDGSILIEMSYYYPSTNLKETIFQLGLAGFHPILAHPERYSYMAGELDAFTELRHMGCRFQLNLLSLTGAYGPASIRIIRHLSKKGWCDFFATDLHSLPQLDRIMEGKLPLPLRFRHIWQ